MPVPGSETSGAVERVSLRITAAERIRTAIFDGTLLPGEQLNDPDLQAWLGISRTPIREALNDLARVGLVEMSPQRYTRVASPKPEDRTLILQTLGALIGGVVRVTTSTLTDSQKSKVVEAIDAVLATVDARSSSGHGAAGWAMVDLFIAACPNPYLVSATRDTIEALNYQLTATRTSTSTAWDTLESGYPRLREAVIAGDSIAAELAVETIFRL